MCHHLDNAFTLQETQILNLSFSLKGLVFLLLLLFGLVGWLWGVCVCVCVYVCSSILAKKQLSKDEQSLGAKITATPLILHNHCFPELRHLPLLFAQRSTSFNHEVQWA